MPEEVEKVTSVGSFFCEIIVFDDKFARVKFLMLNDTGDRVCVLLSKG